MEYLSPEGLEKIKHDLEELKTKKRLEIAERLEHAKSLGDLSENAEYQETKEEQTLVENHIGELEERIRNAVLIEEKHGTDIVVVGSTVVIKSDKGQETYTIVGSEEANPGMGKISNESPLGSGFLGHRVGDVVAIKTPNGGMKYQILKIQ